MIRIVLAYLLSYLIALAGSLMVDRSLRCSPSIPTAHDISQMYRTIVKSAAVGGFASGCLFVLLAKPSAFFHASMFSLSFVAITLIVSIIVHYTIKMNLSFLADVGSGLVGALIYSACLLTSAGFGSIIWK